MLSKKHYEAIAKIIDGVTIHRPTYPRDPIIYRGELVKDLAAYFAGDNPRFDAERFIAACQKELTDGSA